MKRGKEPKFEATADTDITPWVRLAVTAYDKEGLIGAWSKQAGVLSFFRTRSSDDAESFLPTPLPPGPVADIIEAWLDTIDYPVAPSTDGMVTKGWKLRTTFRGFEVEPAWVVYSK